MALTMREEEIRDLDKEFREGINNCPLWKDSRVVNPQIKIEINRRGICTHIRFGGDNIKVIPDLHTLVVESNAHPDKRIESEVVDLTDSLVVIKFFVSGLMESDYGLNEPRVWKTGEAKKYAQVVSALIAKHMVAAPDSRHDIYGNEIIDLNEFNIPFEGVPGIALRQNKKGEVLLLDDELNLPAFDFCGSRYFSVEQCKYKILGPNRIRYFTSKGVKDDDGPYDDRIKNNPKTVPVIMEPHIAHTFNFPFIYLRQDRTFIRGKSGDCILVSMFETNPNRRNGRVYNSAILNEMEISGSMERGRQMHMESLAWDEKMRAKGISIPVGDKF